MNTVTLLKNPKYYPQYTHTLTTYKTIENVTPNNQDSRSGYIELQLSYDEIMAFNYLKIVQDTTTRYAWVTDVVHISGGKTVAVYYEVDPLRTWYSNLDLDNQFVLRSPTATNLYDNLLGSTQEYNDIDVDEYTIGTSGKRVLIVQTFTPSGEANSQTPVNPNPYQFWAYEYTTNAWAAATPISSLMAALQFGGEPTNIITMYSVPYFDLTGYSTNTMTINDTVTVSGFYLVSTGSSFSPSKVTTETSITIPSGLTKTKHSVVIVIPEAGLMEIPDELLYVSGLALRMDVDIFSGAANYALTDGSGNMYAASVRGSALANIPVFSDPELSYKSRNQTAIATSLLGDVGSIAAGVWTTVASEGALAPVGASQIIGGVRGLVTTAGNVKDAGKVQTNPPAFLGSALVANFSGKFWVVITQTHVTNETLVHSELGYPCNILKALSLPSSGFIQTAGCAVKSDGSVPKWAIDEINQTFDRGIKIET